MEHWLYQLAQDIALRRRVNHVRRQRDGSKSTEGDESLRAEIHTTININFDCENKYIDKVWILENPNPNEYAEMLEKEFDKYVHKLFEDDEDMEITSIKTEIKSIEDIPKKEKSKE